MALGIFLFSCGNEKTVETENESPFFLSGVQTSAEGDKLKEISQSESEGEISIKLFVDSTFQTIEGFGGAFTESSAYLLNQLSDKNRDSIMQAYFSKEGANYSLCRTHMNSCDFSLNNYSYAPIEGDTALENFSIEEDMDDLIPMIKEAQAISENGFKLIASPWTAPPWMKDNKDWNGGKLLPEYHDTWAKFFVKYANAYAEQGIDIWSFTVENEPLGNNYNWESMHYTPEEMGKFVQNNLGPELEKAGLDIKLLMYDQNRGEELEEWSSVLLQNEELDPYVYGMAIHWYNSTYDVFEESLQFTHNLAPDKHIIETEGCIDAEVPHWQDDAWYWSKEATDWGWDWAEEDKKHFHPKYVPVFRYARDIIGCMNNWVEGWVDWNMVLDDKGGPNHAKNWCIAPIIVKEESDEVYFTPLYYTMCHFSKYIEPGSKRILHEIDSEKLLTSSVVKPNGDIAVLVLNTSPEPQNFNVESGNSKESFSIAGNAIQTLIFADSNK